MATTADGLPGSASPPPAGTTGPTATQVIDRWIYVFMAALFVVTALTGFIPTSIEKVAAVQAGQRPPFPPVLHVHAVLMGAWLLLLLTQATLQATGRKPLHWKLGLAAFALVPAIVVTGLLLVPTMRGLQWDAIQAVAPGPQRAMLEANFERPINILLVQLRMGIVFTTLVTWSLLVRRSDSGLHKRLWFLGTSILLPAAIDRMEWLPTTFPQNFVAPDLYTLLLVSPMFAWDLFRLGKVHRAYLIWLGVLVLPTVAVHALWGTDWWQAIGPKILGLA